MISFEKGTGGDQRHVQARRLRLEREHDFTDVARDHCADLAHRRRRAGRHDGIRRRTLVVVGDDLDLRPLTPPLALISSAGDLARRPALPRRQSTGLPGDHADLDRAVRLREGRQCGASGEGGQGRRRFQDMRKTLNVVRTMDFSPVYYPSLSTAWEKCNTGESVKQRAYRTTIRNAVTGKADAKGASRAGLRDFRPIRCRATPTLANLPTVTPGVASA